MPASEARQHPRARARIKVEYHFGASTGVGYTNDISEGGIFLAAEPVAQVGTRIYLRMHLPGGLSGDPLKIIGLVTRSSEDAATPGMGIHFEVAYARTRDALGEFVDAALAVGRDSRRDIVRVEGAGDGDAAFAVSFPVNGAEPPSQLSASEVKQAFAFVAPGDGRRIRQLGWWLMFALAALGFGYWLIRVFFGPALAPG